MGCFEALDYCPVYLVVNGTGWAPNTTYPLTISGPNMTGTTGNTATTDASGTITSSSPGDLVGLVAATGTNASTSGPPTPGIYTITMGGVTGTWYWNPPEAVAVWAYDPPEIHMDATGYQPDTTYAETTTYNGAVINSTNFTTDDTGSVNDLNAGLIPTGTSGTIEVNFGGATSSFVVTAPPPTSTPTTTVAVTGSASIAPGTSETITVTSANAPTSDASSPITFTVTGVGGFNGCGTIPATTAAASSPYGGTSTYTAGATSGFCTITAAEGGVSSNSLIVDQT
jgi:hypothetical protein